MSFTEVTAWFILGYAVAAGIALFSRRSRKSYYGQTMGEPTDADAVEEMSPGKRVAAIAFLTVWLYVWTFGVLLALQKRIGLSHGEEGFIFLTIWLAGAIPAWCFVAWTLFRLYRGDHIDMQFDGDGDGDGGGD